MTTHGKSHTHIETGLLKRRRTLPGLESNPNEHLCFYFLQPPPISHLRFPLSSSFSSSSSFSLLPLLSSPFPRPSTDSYNIYDCLEHTLAARNWRAHLFIQKPILTLSIRPAEDVVRFILHQTALQRVLMWRRRAAQNSSWSKCNLQLWDKFRAPT